MAPDVTFGAYRVFGCSGATSADVMLAAMERVYRDGADVLNMSIGENLQQLAAGARLAQAASRLVDKGVVVVAAAGNDRLDGLWATGAPGVGERVISVASVDNLKQLRRPRSRSRPTTGRSRTHRPARLAPIPTGGTFEIARTGTRDDAGRRLRARLRPAAWRARSRSSAAAPARSASRPQTPPPRVPAAVVFYNNAGADRRAAPS